MMFHDPRQSGPRAAPLLDETVERSRLHRVRQSGIDHPQTRRRSQSPPPHGALPRVGDEWPSTGALDPDSREAGDWDMLVRSPSPRTG